MASSSIRRRDPHQQKLSDSGSSACTGPCSGRILPIDAAVADRWGALNVPDPLPTVDGLLAATALVHGLTLVTGNTRHVRSTGVTTLDPFAGNSVR